MKISLKRLNVTMTSNGASHTKVKKSLKRSIHKAVRNALKRDLMQIVR